jgi:hypothetical protein
MSLLEPIKYLLIRDRDEKNLTGFGEVLKPERSVQTVEIEYN